MRIASLLLATALCSCAVGPGERSLTPQQSLPDVMLQDGVAEPDWWRAFDDRALTNLINMALADNPDLDAAIARIGQARAQAQLSRAALLPTGRASASYERQRVSTATGSVQAPDFVNPSNFYDAGFDASWELDLFGANRRRLRSARANFDASVADSAALSLTVSASVVRAYADYRLAVDLLQLNDENLAAQRETVRLADVKQRLGDRDALEKEQAEARLAQIEAERPSLLADRTAAAAQLATLTGSSLGEVETLVAQGKQLSMPSVDQLAIAPTALRTRPDVIAAERRVAAATHLIGAEIAALFPSLSVSGVYASQVNFFEDLGSSDSIAWTAGPSLNWRLLDFVRIDAAIDEARGREREALANYRLTVLAAAEEVVSEYARAKALSEEMRLRSLEVAAQERALATVKSRYRFGDIEYLVVLDTERELRTAQQQRARSQAAAATTYASLAKAVGTFDVAATLEHAASTESEDRGR